VDANTAEVQIRKLTGKSLKEALFDKLADRHAGLIRAKSEKEIAEHLAELIEIVFSLGTQSGISEGDLMEMVEQERKERGGYREGHYRHVHWKPK